MDNNQISNEPYYQNPQDPYQPQGPNGLAIASLVLGIISIPTICCYGLGILLGIIGIVLGIVSRKSGTKMSGMAIAGIILSAIGILFGILFWILAGIGFSMLTSEDIENILNSYD